MTSVWFVTPAWQRFDLTRICLEQRAHAIADLNACGITAECVVIADDDNLDIADELGFHTLERPNYELGRKFNDGHEYACRNGADYVVPIGSDSWIDPAFFDRLPRDKASILTSALYAAVDERGERFGALRFPTRWAVGPWVISRELLEPGGFRPADDTRRAVIDKSTRRGIRKHATPSWVQHNYHEAQYVGFRSSPQINSYEALSSYLVREDTDPFGVLRSLYPDDLVDDVQAFYAARR